MKCCGLFVIETWLYLELQLFRSLNSWFRRRKIRTRNIVVFRVVS